VGGVPQDRRDSVIVGDDTHLQGECTIAASDGSHGNLGDRDVDAGDTPADQSDSADYVLLCGGPFV
jgi:hypothetical protein